MKKAKSYIRKNSFLLLVILCISSLCACRQSDDSTTTFFTNIGNDTYYNIATTNNLLSYAPIVISDEYNIGDVNIRVLDDHGQIIISNITIAPRETVVLKKIPAFSGNCTIQGQATDASGEYTFKIQ